MDTQGVFDRDSTVKDCATLFALTNLISSVQIYNLMQQLQEDDLQNLQINSNQHDEIQEVRKMLGSFFQNISGFLLPYPGKAVVTNKTYDGLVKELDDDFVDNVKLFVPYILSEEFLIAKRIHNKTVTGEYILKYVKAFVELLERDESPSPQTAFKATAEVGRDEAIKRAFRLYKSKMEEFCVFYSGKLISVDTFETLHKQSKLEARDNLKETPKLLLLEHECECNRNLDILIEEEYTKLKKILKLEREAERAAAAERKANSRLAILRAVGTGVGFGFGSGLSFFWRRRN